MSETLFDLSPKAAAHIQNLKQRDNKSSYFLKVSVVGGGCSGMSYKLDFVEAPKPEDKTFIIEGVDIAIDPKSILFLKGTVLDFSDGLNGQGFVFQNPNAKTSCGCGSSFSA
jgi:iron-sulfur cluster assembly protein